MDNLMLMTLLQDGVGTKINQWIKKNIIMTKAATKESL